MAGLGKCVASVPLPSGPNTGSNLGGGVLLKKIKNKNKKFKKFVLFQAWYSPLPRTL